MIGTLWVGGTLWLALNVGISLETWQTGTGCCLVPLSADSIEAAGTWSAGIYDLWLGRFGWKLKLKYFSKLGQQRKLTSCESALSERISLVSLVTDTQRDVVPHFTVSPCATETRAGVPALSRDTGKLWGTVGVKNTLRLTVRRRTDHVRQTGALAPVSRHPW